MFEFLLARRYIKTQKRHSALTICSIVVAVTLMSMLFTGFATLRGCMRAAHYDFMPYHMRFSGMTSAQMDEIEKLPELKTLIESDKYIYTHGYSPSELQDMLSRRELPPFIDKKGLSSQLVRILDLAAKGLEERGKNEQHFLAPLYIRAEKLTNPAREMVQGLENGLSMRHFIEKYSEV